MYKVLFALLVSLSILSGGLALNTNQDGKGIAMAYAIPADVEAVGASWFYYYGSCSEPKCVPMSWCGEDINLSPDYSGFALMFNEPENEVQCNITPEVALSRYEVLITKYPNAKWVVGNSIFCCRLGDWLHTFRSLIIDNTLPLPYAWGIHIYVGGRDIRTMMFIIRNRLESLHNDFNAPIWVTEFAAVDGNIKMDDALLEYLKSVPWIERYAYFTNRAKGDEPWYPSGWKVQLFDFDTGNLTNIGRWYKNGLTVSFLSMVSK